MQSAINVRLHADSLHTCIAVQQDKLQFPMEVPIIPLQNNDGFHVLDEVSAAGTPKALIHFDMAAVSRVLRLFMWHV